MSVESQYLGNWSGVSSCAQDPMQQWRACGSQSVNMNSDWTSSHQSSVNPYPVTYPTEEMRVPMCHPGMDTQYPQFQHQDSQNFMWSKASMDSQCQNYLRFSTNNLHATTVARRNERERNRVRHINSTFENLRQHLPCNNKKKKLSKVDTLRTAIKYIKHLKTILGDEQDTNQKHVIKTEKDSENKRQSLDTSVNSTSSIENGELEGEAYGASPCSSQNEDSQSSFVLPSTTYSWTSS